MEVYKQSQNAFSSKQNIGSLCNTKRLMKDKIWIENLRRKSIHEKCFFGRYFTRWWWRKAYAEPRILGKVGYKVFTSMLAYMNQGLTPFSEAHDAWSHYCSSIEVSITTPPNPPSHGAHGAGLVHRSSPPRRHFVKLPEQRFTKIFLYTWVTWSDVRVLPSVHRNRLSALKSDPLTELTTPRRPRTGQSIFYWSVLSYFRASFFYHRDHFAVQFFDCVNEVFPWSL